MKVAGDISGVVLPFAAGVAIAVWAGHLSCIRPHISTGLSYLIITSSATLLFLFRNRNVPPLFLHIAICVCMAYCGILSKHNLCATGTTGKLISEQTGLTVDRFLSGEQGGDQQIGARVAVGEIDIIIFF